MPGSEAEKSDDIRHLERVLPLLSDSRSTRMTTAVNLLGEVIALTPRPQWTDMFPNDLAGLACHARSYRDLRAAVTLLTYGYYGQARAVLRGVYESATIGRKLAKEPELAEKWIRRRSQFQDKEVRRWAVDSGLISEADDKTYAQMYQYLGRWAHSTLDSCRSYIKTGESRLVLQVATEFDSELFFTLVAEIASMAIFCCFAVRNSAVDERAIDAGWRQRLSELSPEILQRDMEHLERDWEYEKQQYADLRGRVQAADRLHEHLRAHPASWRNVKSAEPPSTTTAS